MSDRDCVPIKPAGLVEALGHEDDRLERAAAAAARVSFWQGLHGDRPTRLAVAIVTR
jgi:hypothetical protein